VRPPSRIADATGKNLGDYLHDSQGSDLLDYLTDHEGGDWSTLIYTDHEDSETPGTTWIYPDVAISFANWASPGFAVMCFRQVHRMFERKTYAQPIINFNAAEEESQSSEQTLAINAGELIPIDTSAGTPRADARSLHASLGNKRDFYDWFKHRTEECGLIDNEYGALLKFEPSLGGRLRLEYWVNLEAARGMAIMESNEQGKKIRRYISEVEKKFRAR
jgi:phage anti-repressor protein